MDIVKQFEKMGARAIVKDIDQDPRFSRINKFSIDIQRDSNGEYFEVLRNKDNIGDLDFSVVDVQSKDRHLLLAVKDNSGREKQVSKFLCGHDERHWFTCAVPNRSTSNVKQAKEELKPGVARRSQDRKGVKTKNRHKRKNKGFIRQGEWFFIPEPDLKVDKSLILAKEPISRGRGKPHIVQFLYRSGGETVYVNSTYPNGISQTEYNKLITSSTKAKRMAWRVMRRGASVYAKGHVRHADHKTLNLKFWHRVELNLESGAPGAERVTFLD